MDITAIIPAYNAEATIEECFKSVYIDLKHSGYVFEIIIINDGSVDGTRGKLAKIQLEHGEAVKVIDQENKGVASARNVGLKIAMGKYIAFCDSDDLWINGKTSLSMNILKKYPEIKCLGVKYVGKNSKENKLREVDLHKNLRYITIHRQIFRNHFSTPATIISYDIIKNNIYFNENMRYSEDFDFFNRIVVNYTSVFLDIVLTKSIIGKNVYGESGLSGNLWNMEKGEVNAICRMYKHLNIAVIFLAIAFSMVKYVKRMIIVFIRKTILS
jgi:glycosyltransferase involved in cell wall biosynthesis